MKNLIILCSAVLLMSLSASARDALYGSASAEYKVKATVDSFTGKASSDPFVVAPDADRVAITFKIALMETGKKKRDKEMLHMFHADDFPIISGSADAAAVLALTPSAAAVDLPINVVMHGVTREVVGKVSNVTKTDGETEFDVAFPLVLSQFDLKAPSVMMMIRVADEVQVTSHIRLSAKAPSASAESM